MRKNKGLFYFVVLYLTILYMIVFSFSANTFAFAEEVKYYLGGQVAGFVLKEDGISVLSITDIFTQEGIVSPGDDAGLKQGDKILSVNGKEISSCEKVDEILKNYKSGELVLKIKRNEQILLKNITPCKDINGKYKLGLIIRDAISGIGTVTYINSNGEFSALGHPVIDNDNIFSINGGNIYNCKVIGVKKSKRGSPGEIKGFFTETNTIGKISCNKENGIKGSLNKYDKTKEIKLGKAEIGNASIFSCVDGYVKEYAITIAKCDYNNRQNKNFVIKVTDENLLKLTGGIVQGMSGSPIVQNDKLVGAVTHVFVNDTTRGFGISIDNLVSNN